jgi:hypothetical protein
MKQKGHDYSELLIWAAALVTVVRYAAAFIASDATEIGATLSEIITIAMGVSGLGMGVLDVIGGTYLFTGWQKKMPANGQAWSFKFKILTFFAIGLIVNGILILIPFTASRVSGNTMFHILGDGFFLYAWSAVVNIAPYLLVGGVAVGNTLVTIDTVQNGGQLTGQMTGTDGQKPDNNQTDIKVTDWRSAKKQLTGQQIHAIAQSKTSAVMEQYSLSDRTARRWIEAAKKESPPPFP